MLSTHFTFLKKNNGLKSHLEKSTFYLREFSTQIQNKFSTETSSIESLFYNFQKNLLEPATIKFRNTQ